MSTAERSTLEAFSSGHGLTHEGRERTNSQPQPCYLPLGNAQPVAKSISRTAGAIENAAAATATIFADAPTIATNTWTGAKTPRGSHSRSSDLGEVWRGNEVESDVLAVEEVCRELMRVEIIRESTGFGCPATTLAQTGTLMRVRQTTYERTVSMA